MLPKKYSYDPEEAVRRIVEVNLKKKLRRYTERKVGLERYCVVCLSSIL